MREAANAAEALLNHREFVVAQQERDAWARRNTAVQQAEHARVMHENAELIVAQSYSVSQAKHALLLTEAEQARQAVATEANELQTAAASYKHNLDCKFAQAEGNLMSEAQAAALTGQSAYNEMLSARHAHAQLTAHNARQELSLNESVLDAQELAAAARMQSEVEAQKRVEAVELLRISNEAQNKLKRDLETVINISREESYRAKEVLEQMRTSSASVLADWKK